MIMRSTVALPTEEGGIAPAAVGGKEPGALSVRVGGGADDDDPYGAVGSLAIRVVFMYC